MTCGEKKKDEAEKTPSSQSDRTESPKQPLAELRGDRRIECGQSIDATRWPRRIIRDFVSAMP